MQHDWFIKFYSKTFPLLLCLLLTVFGSVSTCIASIELTQTLANNPNPEISSDTYVATTGFSALISPTITLNMKHKFQIQGGERTEYGEFNITGGSPHQIYYKISHGAGQRSNYFSSTTNRIQLVKREIKSGLGGFYEYREDNYGFGIYRQAEFGPGYTWMGNLIYMGLRIEKAASNSMSFLYLVSASHRFKYIVGRVNAKLYAGPQYTFDEATVNTPDFGLKLKIRGQWLPPGMIKNMQVSYGVNGLLINTVSRTYRRLGVELGVVYEY